MPPAPEALARQQIDAQLVAAGWIIQDHNTLAYAAKALDRSVVVPDHGAAAKMEQPQVDPKGERLHASQIRTVLSTYRDVLPVELFPGRTLVPKTLIFAKDDSHAEDIVHLCREVFGRGNDICKKTAKFTPKNAK